MFYCDSIPVLFECLKLSKIPYINFICLKYIEFNKFVIFFYNFFTFFPKKVNFTLKTIYIYYRTTFLQSPRI